MESYTFTETAKRILIPKSYKGKGVNILTNMLVDYGIIQKCSWYNFKQKNAYELTDDIKEDYPEILNYFEERITRDGWYQLRFTEYGVQHIWDFIIMLDNKEMEER